MKKKTIRKKFFTNLFKRPCLGKWDCYIKPDVSKAYADSCPSVKECKRIAYKRADRIDYARRKSCAKLKKDS